MQSDGRFEVLSVEGASSLRISPVMMEDEGGVACEANNTAGRSRTDAKLWVHGEYYCFSLDRQLESISDKLQHNPGVPNRLRVSLKSFVLV